ncbi:M28 family peptidase [Sphingomonas sp. MMS12-HWE2-04]|uniref:M28 family peptidase n=1 Tax=Sphingomonas sp. MMS12-HWE2-04 TaxID=3234199 RepID=UPI00384BA1FE
MLRYILPLLLLAPAVQAQQLPPEQAAIKAHVQFLASDALRGREAGTRDFDVAAEYVASQMLALGLEPGGANGSWFQPVQLTAYRPSEKAGWTLTRGGTTEPFVFGTDFINAPIPATPDFAAEGQVVFAGYGLVFPDGSRDDYAGLDVAGKIVALLPGVPKGMPNAVQAHFSGDDWKAQLAQARGAKAVVMLESPIASADYPFATVARFYDYLRYGWAGPDAKPYMIAPGAPVAGTVSRAGAAKLFAGSAIKWKDVATAEAKGKRIPTGPLAATLTLAAKTKVRTIDSRNVVGLLKGSDPALASEVIVLSAHLDHVGVGEGVNGDRIYNGAMDNAVGTAMILDVAKRIAAGKRPRRSLVFVALTAEEKGLIGSDYFAHHPSVPGTLVADINLDMPILTYPLQDLVILGGERSSIGPAVAAAAATEGLKTVPDPTPEEMFFVRSDHYSFVTTGIPAISIDTGPGGEGAAAQRKFLDENYHKPSDQIGLPFDWNAAAKFARVATATARTLANADARPRWNKGDFFGLQFGGYGAK